MERELVKGEPAVIAIISWIQDHADKYVYRQNDDSKMPISKAAKVESSGRFSRYWIYSHHIYSKIKRKNILDMSREYDVTGFCLPGKPGILCIEGDEKNCSDWWSVVRNWNWKRLSLKIIEEEEGEVEGKRIFQGFCEIGEVKSGSRDYHMDMGQFQTFLDQQFSL